MLTIENLREFTDKYQTTDRNVVREYVQHLFLSNLYANKDAVRLAFKGGTALRLIYQSPRFSEDLDFTGYLYHHQRDIDELLLTALAEVKKSGLTADLKEAKLTSGGYFGAVYYRVYGFSGNINVEISLRKPKQGRRAIEVTTISGDYTIPYSVVQLSTSELVGEKIKALLRRAKPRDFYDLYYILRSNLSIDKRNLELGLVLEKLASIDIDFKKELKVLLPRNHHIVLTDFKNILTREIKRQGF